MSNNKDFKVKNGIQPTVYHEAVGTVVFGSESYSLAGASYDGVSFSVASQDTNPYGIVFSSDGTKLYMIGSINNTIYQYSLSTAFDLSTASYASKSFSVASQDTSPLGMSLNNDGTKLYVLGFTNKSVYQYSLSTAFDISTSSYDSVSFSVVAQDTVPYGMHFSSDGTKLFVVGITNKSVYQYSLSTAFDLSTASYDSVSFSVLSETVAPREITFSSDGTKMFILTDYIAYQYSLSTAFDLSTASYDIVNFSLASQDTATFGFSFNNDGTKMFVVGRINDTIYQYSTVLNTASLDLSTGSVFEITPTSDIQVTLTNPAASGTSSGATLLLDSVGTAYTITYDTSIQWSGGTAPTSPAIGETDVITFDTRDGGTSYQGVLAIDGAK